jgi:ribonuclease P protein component
MRKIISTREYRKVYNNHYRISGNLFIFLIQRNEPEIIEEPECAIGIIASKKVGNAVIRNKTKRRVRAFLRDNNDLLPANAKIVIIAKHKAGSASWNDFQEDLTKIFYNINKKM